MKMKKSLLLAIALVSGGMIQNSNSNEVAPQCPQGMQLAQLQDICLGQCVCPPGYQPKDKYCVAFPRSSDCLCPEGMQLRWDVRCEGKSTCPAGFIKQSKPIIINTAGGGREQAVFYYCKELPK